MSRTTYRLDFPLGELWWVNITGDGRDNSDKKDGSKMQKEASLYLKTDSPECKALKEQIDEVWKKYKAENPKIKPATKPKSLGYKVVKDKDTDEETDVTAFVTKTNSFFPDGKPCKIPVYGAKGELLDMGDTEIGNGSIGTIYADAGGYEYLGSYGISLYLKAVQIIPSKLKERTGSDIEPKDLSAYGDESDAEAPSPI